MNSDATIQPLPIFVYGTLMLGQPNDHIWQNSISNVEIAFVTKGCLYDFGYYPILTEEPLYQVMGQIIHVKQDQFDQTIKRLDALEGIDPAFPYESIFRRLRKQAETRTEDSRVTWTYVGNKELVQGLPVVEHGDWAEYVAGTSPDMTARWRTINSVNEQKPQTGDSDH